MKVGAGVGLVIGLLSPPLLASVVVGGAVGDLVGRFAKHKVDSGLGEKMATAPLGPWTSWREVPNTA
jgi:arylsulfatase